MATIISPEASPEAKQCVCWRSDVATVEMETIGASALRRPSSCGTARNDVLAEYFLMQARNTDGVDTGMPGFFGSIRSLGVQAPLLGEWNRVRILVER